MKRLILFSILFSFVISASKAEAQILKTKLRITVLDELGNVVPDATVTLYSTKDDYNNETNPVQAFQLTYKRGRALFTKLQLTQYYVIVRKGDKNNSGAGEVIGEIEKGKLNKANIVISEF